ncbi:GntR family transcriptional regulator [Bacillus benzoevorans]|uniref:DNA-binding GntR family transcriptional regulator n=1 Tax=Bacillus benzoevorans TaxID=1456 RepID=A0A7X0LW77_9BACI|nr:GntR family transcriptional regulator [Bacillus benzoevorans]MBB6446320.1 DNA-binding GntR family transcriptional regulator [Bacillus benzoevorans]
MSNSILEGFNESLPEKVAKYILEEIFVGNLKQGDRLIESSIAARFNVSHAPVREALYILEKKNAVERFPRKGVRIRVIDDKEIRDLIEALVGIIQLSSNLIEKNWSQEKYSQLQEIYLAAQMELENENIQDYILTVAQFLIVFVGYANNSVYQRFTSEILFITTVFCKTKWTQTLIEKFHAQLTSSLEAIKENNFEKAGERLSRTIWISVD